MINMSKTIRKIIVFERKSEREREREQGKKA